MPKKVDNNKTIGAWAFLIGVLLAIILGLFSSSLPADASGIVVAILVIIGIVVGLFNIGGEETSRFLLAALSLVIASALGGGVMSSVPYIKPLLDALLILFVPTTIIVALKSVFVIARN